MVRFTVFVLCLWVGSWCLVRAEHPSAESSVLARELAAAEEEAHAILAAWLKDASPREVLEREGARLRKQYVSAPEAEQFRITALLGALSRALARDFPEPKEDGNDPDPTGLLYPPGVRLFLQKTDGAPEVALLLLEGYCLRAPSMILLDMLYFHGVRTEDGQVRLPPHHPEILAFWRQMADEGLPRGLLTLGRARLHGLGVEEDIEQGLSLLERSGLEEAWSEMAMHYYRQRDLTLAAAWWRYAALETNDPQAWYNLGSVSIEMRTYGEALSSLQHALRLHPEHHASKIELARLYLEGWGVDVDLDRAEALLREVLATDRNALEYHAYADVNLGELYRRRRQASAGENRARFAQLRGLAAERDPVGMRELALMMTGEFEGIEARPSVGLEWLQHAADAGDPVAQRILGLIRVHGMQGVTPPEPEQGVALLKAAAEAGDTEARFRLGALYFEGRLVPENSEKAQSLFRAAAEAGYPLAMSYLGLRLWEGRGFPKDAEEGHLWIKRSAESGSPEGLNVYTLFLLEQDPAERNPYELYIWSTLGIRSGEIKLRPMRDFMAMQLTEDQWNRARAEVERRFRAFQE